jgi:hypothetical protein
MVTALKAYDAAGEQGKDESQGHGYQWFIHLNRPIGKEVNRARGAAPPRAAGVGLKPLIALLVSI